MAESRDNYAVFAHTLEELNTQLSFILQRISDRLDQIEGVRGQATIRSNLDMEGNRIEDVANFNQDLNTDDTPAFSGGAVNGDLVVSGDFTVNGTSSILGDVLFQSIEIRDENDELIHSMGDV